MTELARPQPSAHGTASTWQQGFCAPAGHTAAGCMRGTRAVCGVALPARLTCGPCRRPRHRFRPVPICRRHHAAVMGPAHRALLAPNAGVRAARAAGTRSRRSTGGIYGHTRAMLVGCTRACWPAVGWLHLHSPAWRWSNWQLIVRPCSNDQCGGIRPLASRGVVGWVRARGHGGAGPTQRSRHVLWRAGEQDVSAAQATLTRSAELAGGTSTGSGARWTRGGGWLGW